MKVIVVGAGVFGAWSAWFLAEAGHRVTLIDAYGPANGRASSADHSRVIRCGYGADAIYSEWARASFEDWRWLSTVTDRELVARTGALFMGAPSDPYIQHTYATLSKLGIRSELLDPETVNARFAHMSVTGLGLSVLEADAGIIRAREAVQALVEFMRAHGAITYAQACVGPVAEMRHEPSVHLLGGEQLRSDAFVFACGPWLPSLFPSAVGDRIRPTRQEILYFGVPPGDRTFSIRCLPAWIDFQAGMYGIPDLDACGFKVGIDRHGPPIDPDRHERIVDRDVVRRTRAWLAFRFPKMRDAPLVDARVCQYENTSTGDFIIDRHPHWSNVWIVGGGSGHGFKHGPAVGRQVAALVSGNAEVQARFALATKDTTAARSIY